MTFDQQPPGKTWHKFSSSIKVVLNVLTSDFKLEPSFSKDILTDAVVIAKVLDTIQIQFKSGFNHVKPPSLMHLVLPVLIVVTLNDFGSKVPNNTRCWICFNFTVDVNSWTHRCSELSTQMPPVVVELRLVEIFYLKQGVFYHSVYIEVSELYRNFMRKKSSRFIEKNFAYC